MSSQFASVTSFRLSGFADAGGGAKHSAMNTKHIHERSVGRRVAENIVGSGVLLTDRRAMLDSPLTSGLRPNVRVRCWVIFY